MIVGMQLLVEADKALIAANGKDRKTNYVYKQLLVLYYFCGYIDKAISKLYGYCRSTTNYQRQAALKQLRKELEHEKR